MNEKNLNATNKKKAGDGNGNSIMTRKSMDTNAKDYVSGDAFPTSIGHQFGNGSHNSTNKSQ